MHRLLYVAALLIQLPPGTPLRAEAPQRVLLIGHNPDGHPPQTHEYMAGLKILAKCLEPVGGLQLTTTNATDPWREGPGLLKNADAAVLFVSEGAKWLHQDPQRLAAFNQMAGKGRGFVALHWAIGTKEAQYIDGYVKLLGGCHGGPDRKFKVLEAEVSPADPKHPVAAGISPLKARDEFYYQLKFVKPEGTVRPVLRAAIDGKDETVAWAWERPDGGRSVGFSGLHFHENWRLPAYRRLAAQAVLWTLRREIPAGGLPVAVSEEELKGK